MAMTDDDTSEVDLSLSKPQVVALIRAADYALWRHNQGYGIWPRGPDDAHDRMEQAREAACRIEEQAGVKPETMAASKSAGGD